MQITDLNAHALSQAIRSRQVSCREVVAATLARIALCNPVHNAIVSLRDEAVLLREADGFDDRLRPGRTPQKEIGWMYGMPQAIKDLSDVAGLPTTQGSPLMRDFVPSADGLLAQRMKAAGCIVIGKTNTPEFGLGSHTFNDVFGTTRNAYDPRKSAGGSSGGAAVALATHMLPVADGSDFMGSLRNPAAWNNVFGLRPSAGRVPTWPAREVWMSPLGTEGPMGRSVKDVAMLLGVQAGYDARVPLSLEDPERFDADLEAGFDARSVRIGWLGDLGGYLPVEPGLVPACEAGLQRLAGMGCHVEPVAPAFHPPEVWEIWRVLRRWLVAGRIATQLARPENRARLKPEALWEHDQASDLSAAQALAASAGRSAFLQQMLKMLASHDVLVLPSTQVWPFDAALRWPTHVNGRAMDTYHRWMEVVIYASLAGLPCLNVPVGFSAEGLPAGMQLIGQPRGELALLKLGHAYQQAAQDVLSVRPASPATAG